MASCDFSTHEYSYADVAKDFNLTHFRLAPEDLKFKVPHMSAAKALSGGRLRFFGSPWSAPAWMKTSGSMSGKGALIGSPGGPYYKTWAHYFTKFLDAYAAQNLSMWAVTVQNEPSTGFMPHYAFQTMAMTAGTERDFVKLDLGPALARSVHKETKIILMDDQRIYVGDFASRILGDPEAARYVAGIGLHWYMDFMTPAVFLDAVAHYYPDAFLLYTEACTGSLPWEVRGVTLGNWARAESYASDIIENLNHYVGGWVDWNLVLNSTGGPNWVNNNVDAPIIVPNDKSATKFYKQPMYYAIAHFSAFLPVGSKRVKHKLSSSSGLEVASFVTPSNERVLIVLNKFAVLFLFLPLQKATEHC